jgi:hypothetical protein
MTRQINSNASLSFFFWQVTKQANEMNPFIFVPLCREDGVVGPTHINAFVKVVFGVRMLIIGDVVTALSLSLSLSL